MEIVAQYSGTLFGPDIGSEFSINDLTYSLKGNFLTSSKTPGFIYFSSIADFCVVQFRCNTLFRMSETRDYVGVFVDIGESYSNLNYKLTIYLEVTNWNDKVSVIKQDFYIRTDLYPNWHWGQSNFCTKAGLLDLSTYELKCKKILFSYQIMPFPEDHMQNQILRDSILSHFNFALVCFKDNKEVEFLVNKKVLYDASPVFAAMFDKNYTKEAQENRVIIRDMECHICEIFVEYLNKGKVDPIYLECFDQELLVVANKYFVSHLKILCQESLESKLSIDSFVHLLIFADMFNAKQLKLKCFEFYKRNSVKIMTTNDWFAFMERRQNLINEILSFLISNNSIEHTDQLQITDTNFKGENLDNATVPKNGTSCLNHENILNEIVDITPTHKNDLKKFINAVSDTVVIEKELQLMESKKVFKYVPESEGKNVIEGKWDFSYTEDHENRPIYNAQLRAQPEKKPNETEYIGPDISFRAFLTIAVKNGLKLYQLSLKSALWNTELVDKIYMKPPLAERKKQSEKEQNEEKKKESEKVGMIWQISKCIRGLDQVWLEKFHNYLIEYGFKRNRESKYLYSKDNLSIFVYIDDLLISYRTENHCFEFVNELEKKFELQRIGEPKSIFGYNLHCEKGVIFLDQLDHIARSLKNYRMDKSNDITRTLKDYVHSPDKEPCSNVVSERLRLLLSNLHTLQSKTRPDLTANLRQMLNSWEQFKLSGNDPTESLWKAAQYMLRFLKNTFAWKLVIGHVNDTTLDMAVDASFKPLNGNDAKIDTKIDTNKDIITGCIGFLYGSAFMWTSLQQDSRISTTVTIAESQAIKTAVEKVNWIRPMFEDLGFDVGVPRILSDNKRAIDDFNSANGEKYHKVLVEHIPGVKHPADPLTKVMNYAAKPVLLKHLGLRNVLFELCKECGQELATNYRKL